MECTFEKIKSEFYFVGGSLRDISVNNITEIEWEKWINYKINWNNNNKDKIFFEIIKNNWNKNLVSETAKVFIGKIQLNNHFFRDFENDIDPNEINTEMEHNCIINYMRDISKIFNKWVYLTEENYRENYLIKIYKEEIKYNI